MLKRVLYGGGAVAALAGAFLVGSATLGNVFAQSPTPPSTPPGVTAPKERERRQQNKAAEQAALQAQAKITADQAKATAVAKYPGATVKKVKLDNENGTVVYEVELTDSGGKEWDVKVDAGTGTVLSAQADGPDGAKCREGRDDD